MHKGRDCPRFPETFLTITNNFAGFAPRSLKISALIGYIIHTESFVSNFSDPGTVDVDNLKITWNGRGELLTVSMADWELVMTVDPLEGRNSYLFTVMLDIGGTDVARYKNDWFDLGWRPSREHDFQENVSTGIPGTGMGFLASIGKRWS